MNSINQKKIRFSGFLFSFYFIVFVPFAHAANDLIVAPSGGDITGKELSEKLAQGDYTIQSSSGKNKGTGDIIINDLVSWTTNSTLTLIASNNIKIGDKIIASGDSAGIVLNPNTANNNEKPSGKGTYSLTSSITLSGTKPKLSISGNNYIIVNTIGQPEDAKTIPSIPSLQSLAALDSLGQKFALGSDIDASTTSTWNSGAGFTPIGITATGYFGGILDGLGHTVSNLTIKQKDLNPYQQIGSEIALFGTIDKTGIIKNVGLINCDINGNTTGSNSIGGIAAFNLGSILNSFVIGKVHGHCKGYGDSVTGGLVGHNFGKISSCFIQGSVANPNSSIVGGLVASNKKGGTITSSFVNAAITSNGTGAVGGIVGTNAGSISNSYALGNITDKWRDTYGWRTAGGLVGQNCSKTNSIAGCYATSIGEITTSYASVSSNGGAGLVGNNGGTISNCYWNSNLTENAFISNPGTASLNAGLTAEKMLRKDSFENFDFGSTWIIVDADGSVNNADYVNGATYPMLYSEYSTNIVNAHQLQLMAINPNASYSINSNIDATSTGNSSDIWPSSGFVPIGSYAQNFNGTLDGNNNNINGLVINSKKSIQVGLIGLAGNNATIKNVNLVQGSIQGNNAGGIGSISGINYGQINNCSSSATVIGENGGNTGGLVGSNNGTISNCTTSGKVEGNGGHRGGFVGYNGGTLSSCTVNSVVSGLGGLTGKVFAINKGTDNCSN